MHIFVLINEKLYIFCFNTTKNIYLVILMKPIYRFSYLFNWFCNFDIITALSSTWMHLIKVLRI